MAWTTAVDLQISMGWVASGKLSWKRLRKECLYETLTVPEKNFVVAWFEILIKIKIEEICTSKSGLILASYSYFM